MQVQPTLSDREWGVVLQLLQTEREQLPSEIHHTDSHTLAEQLEERERLIDSIMQRIRDCGLQA
jgi:hypothetical protein